MKDRQVRETLAEPKSAMADAAYTVLQKAYTIIRGGKPPILLLYSQIGCC
jgi:hypothetical protein